MAIDALYIPGQTILFSGKRWVINSVDKAAKVISLIPGKTGQAPIFGGDTAPVHKMIRQKMLELYQNDYLPTYCNDETKILLKRGRKYLNGII